MFSALPALAQVRPNAGTLLEPQSPAPVLPRQGEPRISLPILPSAGSVRLVNAMATPLLEVIKKDCFAAGADAGNQDEASVQRNALLGAGDPASRGGSNSRNRVGAGDGSCS